MVKCFKTYLTYQPLDGISYKDMCGELWGLQREVRAAKNKAVSELYENLKWKVAYKEQNGEYPDDVQRYGRKLGQEIYALLCREAPDLQTANVATVQQSLTGKFKNDTKPVLRGDKSIPSFKSDQPIELHNKSIKFTDCGDHIEVSLSLFSMAKKKELGLKNGIVPFALWRPGDSVEKIVRRCIRGEYKHGTGSLKYDRKKRMWVLSVAYNFEAEQHELDPDRICGVDLGVVSPVYCAVNDGYERMNFPGGKIEKFRFQMERRRRYLLKSRAFCGDGSIGHGYRTRVRPADITSGKVANFRDTQNHLISRAVVDFAIKQRCGTIQMEDLSGIGETSQFLKSWPYYDLQMKITQKAKEAGITVNLVDPKYTSQRCHKCGHISKKNRKTQADFECEKCGYKANADFNAAKNLSVKGIEKIIRETILANQKQSEQAV